MRIGAPYREAMRRASFHLPALSSSPPPPFFCYNLRRLHLLTSLALSSSRSTRVSPVSLRRFCASSTPHCSAPRSPLFGRTAQISITMQPSRPRGRGGDLFLPRECWGFLSRLPLLLISLVGARYSDGSIIRPTEFRLFINRPSISWGLRIFLRSYIFFFGFSDLLLAFYLVGLNSLLQCWEQRRKRQREIGSAPARRRSRR